jgi:hypothetical protein
MPESGSAGHDWSAGVFEVLRDKDIRLVATVPDGGLTRLLNLCERSPEVRVVTLTTEEEGIGLLTGSWLGGVRGALLMLERPSREGEGERPHFIQGPVVEEWNEKLRRILHDNLVLTWTELAEDDAEGLNGLRYAIRNYELFVRYPSYQSQERHLLSSYSRNRWIKLVAMHWVSRLQKAFAVLRSSTHCRRTASLIEPKRERAHICD